MKNKTKTNSSQPLLPLDKVIRIKKKDEDAEIDVAQFTQCDPASIPEGLLLYIRDQDFPHTNIKRLGDKLEAYVSWDMNPRIWEHKYGLRFYSEAMVNAAKKLMADGRQLSKPELVDEDYIGASWEHVFPVTTQPAEIVRVIKETFDAIEKGTEALLP